MRYAICITPPIHDSLSISAAEWLGRNIYSDMLGEQPDVNGFSRQEFSFLTAVPRRYGFHGGIKAPFRLAEGVNESMLLKALMRFAGGVSPFEISDIEIAWLGSFYGLAPRVPNAAMAHLAASVVQSFDMFRSPMSDADMERLDPDKLTAPQFANLHRWGDPYVMDEFRFHMPLTGPMNPRLRERMDPAVRTFFHPVIERPMKIASLALFIEPETGAPLRVHSQHPLGKLSEHRPVPRVKPAISLPPALPAGLATAQEPVDFC